MSKRKRIVAIVGRPNVGKSSLFNRFIGNRDAIVDDVAGITRDRHYGVCEWTGHVFSVIDTGGYLPSSHEMFDLAIKEQVEIAIHESDVLLFIVDVRSGVTDTDIQVANIIKNFNKPVILVVNKVDSNQYEHDIYPFYQLGLGDPLPVSAMVGRQSGDLLDEVVKKFEEEPELEELDTDLDKIKIAVVGKENVGKSSYVNAIVGTNRNIVTDVAGTTRDSNDSHFKYDNEDFILIDTAGLKRKARVKENVLFYSQIRTLNAIERADVVLYFIDAESKITKQDQIVISDIVEAQKGLILVVNKWDLIETKSDKVHREFLDDLREKLPRLGYVPIITVSVNENQRLRKIISMAKTVWYERKERIQTSKLNNYFLPIVKRNPPPSAHGKEIKINFVSQVASNPPVIAFFVNDPKRLAEHYKRYLENQLRKEFKFEGVPVKCIFKRKNEDRSDQIF